MGGGGLRNGKRMNSRNDPKKKEENANFNIFFPVEDNKCEKCERRVWREKYQQTKLFIHYLFHWTCMKCFSTKFMEEGDSWNPQKPLFLRSGSKTLSDSDNCFRNLEWHYKIAAYILQLFGNFHFHNLVVVRFHTNVGQFQIDHNKRLDTI